jgi:putative phosphoribosyl transferase
MPSAERCKVEIDAGGVVLPALLTKTESAVGAVIFALPGRLSSFERRDHVLLDRLRENMLATLAIGLMAPEESMDDSERLRFDISRLSGRFLKLLDWVKAALPATGSTGILAKGTAATAALVATTQRGHRVGAVISVDGRPDLAVHALPRLGTPTLLLVREDDEVGLQLNQIGADRMHGPHELRVVSPQDEIIDALSLDWLGKHLRLRASGECHDEAIFRGASSTAVEQIT